MKSAFATAFLSLALVSSASANTDFRILVDLDNNASTGCAVNGMSGVERVFTTTLDTTGATPHVVSMTRQDCSGGSLGSQTTIDATGWPATSNSSTGVSIVETRIPLSAFGSPLPSSMRLGFVAISGSQTATVFTDADGNPILFPDTPARRRIIGGSGRLFVTDGMTGDWNGIQPLANGDSGQPDIFRILNVFAFLSGDAAYFRFDGQSHPAAPTALNDTYTTPLNTALSVMGPGVLGNDTDPNNKPLTATQLSSPDRGALAFNGDGSFTYTPDSGGPTRETFTYQASNGTQPSNVARVEIRVGQANHPPNAGDDNYNVARGGTLNIPAPGVLGNDTDPDGDPLHAILKQTTTHGTLTLNGDGSFVYANDGISSIDDLFTYVASDGTDISREATVHIHVAGPTTAAPHITIPAGDQAVCPGAVVTFSASASGTPAPSVQWQVSTDGGVTFTNIPSATTFTYSFTATLADNGHLFRAVFTNPSGSANTTATLTVNTPPTVTTSPSSATVCAGNLATFTVVSGGSSSTVQWQVSTDGGATFSNVTGATSTTYSFTASVADNAHQFRAVLTNACGAATSAAATLTVNTSPAVTTQPSSQTICAGSPVTFTVAATGTPAPTVQWQSSTDGGATFGDIAGATSTTYSFGTTPADNAKQFRAVFTNSCSTANTNAATLTVTVAPAVTTQPVSQTICTGSTATFTAAAIGPPSPSVQWQLSTDGGATFADIVGATSTTYSFSTTAADNAHQFRAVFTNSCGTATTTAGTLTVTIPPAVTTQPASQSACAGTLVSFLSAASGTPAPTVQWQLSTDGGATFSNIGGATATTYSFTPTGVESGYEYRSIFTNSCGTATTNAATLTINIPPAVTTSPSSQASCAGATASFNAAATGLPAPTVQWQLSTDGGATFNNIAGATSTTYSFATVAADTGHQFRAVFTNLCSTATTAAATLTVDTLPGVSTQPVTQTSCAGTPVSFTSTATSNAGQTVQWQVSTDGGATFNNIPGATSTTYTFTSSAADDGHQFRAVFTNSCGSTNSNPAPLTVNVGPSITSNPASQTLCAPTEVVFTASASGSPAPTVQWEVSINGGGTWSPIPGETNPLLTFPVFPSQSGNQYRAVFTNSCSTATTTAAVLTVNTAPAVLTGPAPQTLCAGATATFTASASAQPIPSVQWQVSTDGGATFNNLAGATSTTLSFVTSAGDDGHQFQAVFTNSCGIATTTAATLTVDSPLTVTQQPVNDTLCAGSTASFTAAVSGPATVQWQVSTDGGTTFNNVGGATSPTYSFVTVAADSLKQFQAVFTNSCGTVTTNAALLTVTDVPLITTQPADTTVCTGSTADFQSNATSSTGSFTQQWQISTDGGATFTDIPGAIIFDYHFNTTAADNGHKFRSVFTNSCGTTISSVATLTLSNPPVVATNPADQTVCSGATATFTASATGGASTVQWQISTDGGVTWGNLGGANANTLTFTTSFTDNGHKYRAEFANLCGVVDTTVATLTVNTAPAITAQPTNQTACDNTTVTFISSASGTPAPTVQWQVSTDGGATFNNVPGATSPTLSFTALAAQNGNKYKAIYTNTCSTATTNVVTLTVNTPPVVTTNPTNSTVVAGSNATFTAAASGSPAPTVQWQLSIDGGATFNDIVGATSATYSFTTVFNDNGHQFRARFTNTCQSDVATTAATLTVTCPTFTFTPNGTMPLGTFGVAYSQNIVMGNTGTGTITVALTNATSVPASFTFTDNGNGTATVASANPAVTGTVSFDVLATNTTTGCSATKTFSFTVQPHVVDDTYNSPNAVGNTQALGGGFTPAPATPVVTYAGNLLTNDAGPGLTVTSPSASNGAGTITYNATGGWLYTPAIGFTGTATFPYTATSNGVSASANVIITVSGRVWYVNPNSGVVGDGRSNTPWNNTNLISGTFAGDAIFVYNGTTSNLAHNITLLASQTLTGEGVALIVNGVTLVNAGTPPTISATSPSADVITVNSGNTIQGVTLTNPNNSLISGAPAGLSVLNSTLTPTGTANGINITGGSGTITITNCTFTGTSSGDVIRSTAGTQAWTFTNSPITQTSGRGINVSGNSGAGWSFDSASTITVSAGTTNGAISVSNNPGSTFTFNGKIALTVSGVARGLFASSNGGTVNIVDGTSTIAASGGPAIDFQSTTIGASGLNFRSVSASGGSNGILLNNTGSSGGLTVNGDGVTTSVGGNSSGGTISNMSGADGTTSGSGIYLNNTKNVVLRRMTVNGTNTNFGIRGFLVNGFTLEFSTVNGTNGTGNNAFPDDSGEGSIYFGNTATNGLSTQGTFTKNNISGGAWDNLHIENTTAGTTTITVKGNTFGLNGPLPTGNQSLIIEARNAGTIVNSVVGGPLAGEANTFTGAPGGLANFTGQTGTTMDVQFKNNVMTNSHPNNNVGGGCLTVASQGIMTFVVDSNSMRDADGSTMTLQKASLGTSFTGKVTNNTLGVTGVANSASKSGNGIFLSAAGAGTIGLTITGNQIRNWAGNAAMFFDNTGGSYTANFTIQSNTMAEPGAGSFSTLAVTNGGNLTSDTVNVCATIGGAGALENTIQGAGGAADVYLGSSGQNGGHTFNLPGYVGASNLANVQAFVAGNNILSGGCAVIAYDDNGGQGSFTGTGTSCPTP